MKPHEETWTLAGCGGYVAGVLRGVGSVLAFLCGLALRCARIQPPEGDAKDFSILVRAAQLSSLCAFSLIFL